MLNRSLSVWIPVLGIALLSTVIVALPVGLAEDEDGEVLLQPLPGLTALQLEDFHMGLETFTEQWSEDEGVGPRYNGSSCSSCHRSPEAGGSGSRSSNVFFFGAQTESGFDPLEAENGPMMKVNAVRGAALNTIPDSANVISLRGVPQLFGLGLVEAIPDSQILALVDENDANGDGASGRAIFDANGRVQRFGTQNTGASLRTFVEQELQGQLGADDV